MSYSSIIDYLKALSKHYFISNRKEKSLLLDHASKITNLHRKSLIRILNSDELIKNNKKGNCGAKVKYPRDLLLPHVKYLWISMERISPKRMKAAFKDWLPFYHENEVTYEIKELLKTMSFSTIYRFLRDIKASDSYNQKGLSTTCPARYMKNKVPINTLDSVIKEAGFTQADTVAHCGNHIDGQYMSSITLTDIHSTWTENRAIFTKKALEVKEALSSIKYNLPFKLKAINTDSGTEFLNRPVFNLCHKMNIKFTRSRPYKKNDNCYVEQKNFTHTRELFGYQRFEDENLKELMNDIYINYWNPLQNFFLPTFKLKEKIRIGSKIQKKYDKPITPYQRLIEGNNLSNLQLNTLIKKKKSLNPFELKKGLEKKLSFFFKQLKVYNNSKESNV